MTNILNRKALFFVAVAPAIMLAACSDNSDYSESDLQSSEIEQVADVPEESASDAASSTISAEMAEGSSRDASTNPPIPDLDDVAINLPKLAYVYDYDWNMPGEDIGKLQRRHADLCEQQGPATCQIMGMSKSGEVDDEVSGVLQMSVKTSHARAFGALLEDTALEAGAEQVSADIKAEELSKQMVDTEARLRARTELRDRLMEVLKTRKGSVEELVEAERGVAQVNEEIDQARSWLKEMQGRVAYSRVNVNYASGSVVSNGFLAPVAGAVGSLGSIFGWLLAVLIVLSAIILPIAGIVWLGRYANRKLGGGDVVTEA